MLGDLIRCISTDGALTVMAADTTAAVGEARRIHGTSAVITAALGRLLTAACFMGASLKGAGQSVTLRVNGGGPAGSVIAVADSEGGVKGYAANPAVELPLNAKGKLAVGEAVGTQGLLTVMKDHGAGEPYIGQVKLVSGEIAEDVTAYYAESEQTPTVCALGVLVSKDLTVPAAGGYLIQLLPGAGEAVIGAVERCVERAEPVTTMLAKGLTPWEICKTVLPEFELELLDSTAAAYRCSCSRDRVAGALVSLGVEELTSMSKEKQSEITCHFCPKRYTFTGEDIRELLEKAR